MRVTALLLMCLLASTQLALANEATGESSFRSMSIQSGPMDGDSQPRYLYRIDVKLWSGELLARELRLGMIQGSTSFSQSGAAAWQEQDGVQVAGTRLSWLVVAEASGEPHPRIKEVVFTEGQQQALGVAQEVSFGDVTLKIYAPHADRFEAQLYRTLHVPDEPVSPGGGLPSYFAPAEVSPEEHLATLSGKLDIPDVGAFSPANADLIKTAPPSTAHSDD